MQDSNGEFVGGIVVLDMVIFLDISKSLAKQIFLLQKAVADDTPGGYRNVNLYKDK